MEDSFGYLWTVHSLYYWWRDFGRAERKSAEAAFSPCYLNLMHPSDVAFGVASPLSRSLTARMREALRHVPVVDVELADCLAPPPQEYQFPRDLYRYG